MRIAKAIFQWAIIIAIGAAFYFFGHYPIEFARSLQITPAGAIVFALSCAFCQVEILKFGTIKPFNCVKCMTGWYSLTFGLIFFGWIGFGFLPIGVFIGAMYEAFKMRFL